DGTHSESLTHDSGTEFSAYVSSRYNSTSGKRAFSDVGITDSDSSSGAPSSGLFDELVSDVRNKRLKPEYNQDVIARLNTLSNNINNDPKAFAISNAQDVTILHHWLAELSGNIDSGVIFGFGKDSPIAPTSLSLYPDVVDMPSKDDKSPDPANALFDDVLTTSDVEVPAVYPTTYPFHQGTPIFSGDADCKYPVASVTPYSVSQYAQDVSLSGDSLYPSAPRPTPYVKSKSRQGLSADLAGGIYTGYPELNTGLYSYSSINSQQGLLYDEASLEQQGGFSYGGITGRRQQFTHVPQIAPSYWRPNTFSVHGYTKANDRHHPSDYVDFDDIKKEKSGSTALTNEPMDQEVSHIKKEEIPESMLPKYLKQAPPSLEERQQTWELLNVATSPSAKPATADPTTPTARGDEQSLLLLASVAAEMPSYSEKPQGDEVERLSTKISHMTIKNPAALAEQSSEDAEQVRRKHAQLVRKLLVTLNDAYMSKNAESQPQDTVSTMRAVEV
ncbi:hypothetical protein BZG36_04627, partial [Bifiguratus adelaidae]